MKLEEEVIRRQRERAKLTAWLLGAFVVLLFFILPLPLLAGADTAAAALFHG